MQSVLVANNSTLVDRGGALQRVLRTICQVTIHGRETGLREPRKRGCTRLRQMQLKSQLLTCLPVHVGSRLIRVLHRFGRGTSTVNIGRFVVRARFRAPLRIAPRTGRTVQGVLSTK